MFCPNCGAESTQGFKYCKLCGGSLSETVQVSAPAPPPVRSTMATLGLAAATVAITLGGLGIVFSCALSLIAPPPPGFGPPVHDASIVAGVMVGFGSATIAFIAFMLIKLFARIMGLPAASTDSAQTKKPFGGYARLSKPFGGYSQTDKRSQPAQLPAEPVSVSSVTEHTTRNFRPQVYEEAKAREQIKE